MNQELIGLENRVKECSVPSVCPFCGEKLEVQEADYLKRKTLEDLQCKKCKEIPCRCGCGLVYFPKDKKDLNCPLCGLPPRN